MNLTHGFRHKEKTVWSPAKFSTEAHKTSGGLNPAFSSALVTMHVTNMVMIAPVIIILTDDGNRWQGGV